MNTGTPVLSGCKRLTSWMLELSTGLERRLPSKATRPSTFSLVTGSLVSSCRTISFTCTLLTHTQRTAFLAQLVLKSNGVQLHVHNLSCGAEWHQPLQVWLPSTWLLPVTSTNACITCENAGNSSNTMQHGTSQSQLLWQRTTWLDPKEEALSSISQMQS
jgi:hypothetical protein